MRNNNNLTQEQQRIYGILAHTIQDGKDISSILKSASREDILQVLTTAKITHFEDHTTYTLTPLGLALRLQNRSKEVNAILTKAQDAGILEEVLTTANITVKSLHDDKTPYTLTPLGYALTFSNRSQEIDAILTKAKEANILKEVLKTTYIAVKSVDYTSFTNKPPYMVILFSYACSLADKTIDYILTKAKEANILKEVLTTANITVEREDIGQVSVLTPFEYQHLNVLTPFGHKCPPYTGCKITIKRKMENDKYEYDIVMPTSHIPSTSPISSNDHDDQKTPTSLDKLSEHKGKVIFGAIVFCIANTIAAALITPWLAITAAVAAIVAISVFVKEIHSEYKQQDADEKSVLKATGTVLSDMIPECIKPQKVGPCI